MPQVCEPLSRPSGREMRTLRGLAYKLCVRASADLGGGSHEAKFEKVSALVKLASQSEMMLSQSDVLVQMSAGQRSFRNCLGSHQS